MKGALAVTLTKQMLHDGSAVVLDEEARKFYALDASQAAAYDATVDRRAFLAGFVGVGLSKTIMGSFCEQIPPEKRPPKCWQ